MSLYKVLTPTGYKYVSAKYFTSPYGMRKKVTGGGGGVTYTRAVASRMWQTMNTGTTFNVGGTSITMGTNTQVSFRCEHVMTQNVTEIAYVYVSPTSAANSVSVKASFEYGAQDTIVPITFNSGQRLVTLAANTILQSDWITLPRAVAANEKFYSRTLAQISTVGHVVPLNNVNTGYNVYGDGVAVGSDYVDSGAPSLFGVGGAGQNYQMLTPVAVIARNQSGSVRAFIGSGDSIMYGTGDGPTTDGGRDRLGLGYANYMLKNRWGFVDQGKVNEQTAALLNGSDTLRKRIAETGWYTDVICEYGINDVKAGRTLTQLQTDITAHVNFFKNLGMRVFYCTLSPRADAGYTAGMETVRTQTNDWIRGGAGGILDGYYETADIFETARNSGVWKTGYNSADMVHPNVTGYVAAAMAFDVRTQMGAWPTPNDGYLNNTVAFSDTFNTKAGQASLGNTEVGNKAWELLSGSGQTTVYQVTASGQAQKTSGDGTGNYATAVADAGSADAMVEVEYAVAGNDQIVIARCTDYNNFYALHSTSTAITIRKKVAGTTTTISSTYTVPLIMAGDVFRLYVKGTSIKAWYNNLLIFDITDASITTGNKFGFGVRGATVNDVVCKLT